MQAEGHQDIRKRGKVMKLASPVEAAYWKGVMDGIWLGLDSIPNFTGDIMQGYMNAAREEVAKIKHVCYSSIIGPYCVFCRKNMESEDYQPYWRE